KNPDAAYDQADYAYMKLEAFVTTIGNANLNELSSTTAEEMKEKLKTATDQFDKSFDTLMENPKPDDEYAAKQREELQSNGRLLIRSAASLEIKLSLYTKKNESSNQSTQNERSTRKLPKVDHYPFDKDDVELWFRGFEVALDIQDVQTERQKFGCLLRMLDKSQIVFLGNVAEAIPPHETPYSESKEILIKKFRVPLFDRIQRLLELELDSGELPSHFLERARRLRNTDDDILKYILLKICPQH
ncbi:Hypothetical predicted protein, partial [Paramuricea clavata]